MTTQYLQGSYFGYTHFPAIFKRLEADIEDFGKASSAVDIFARVDCFNLASEGDKEALEWTRKYLERYLPVAAGGVNGDAVEYLAVKGDGRDVEILSRHPNGALAQLLKTRVAGMNIFDMDSSSGFGLPRFIPSVANTGPQAIYAREILYRYWEEAGRDSSKIPPELLAMAVSFDGDGNPVCSVDLAKYGLSVPVITPRPHREKFNWWNDGSPWDQPAKMTVEFADLEPVEITPYMNRKSPDWKGLYVHAKKKPAPPPDAGQPSSDAAAESPPLTGDDAQRPEVAATTGNPPNRLWIYAGVISVLFAGAVLWCLRKKR